MKRPIICVTEFTAAAADAVQAAGALAHRWNEKVLLVRSVDEREQFPAGIRIGLMEQDRQRMRREVDELHAAGYELEPHVLVGVPENGVSGFALRAHARLIVLACPPLNRLDTWVLGCTAEEIATTSNVPLLLVRSGRPFADWTAGVRRLKVYALQDPADPAPAINELLEALRRVADETVEMHEYPAGAVRHPRESAEECAAAARESGADLLVVATHPLRSLPLWHHTTLAGCLLEASPTNVLCVPDLREAAGIEARPRRDYDLANRLEGSRSSRA